MADAHYELPELAALYDLENGWDEDRAFYRALPGQHPKRVVEVGCGTGLIARAMAMDGHQVTAIDPATAILAAGRQAPGGERVEWVEATAENFSLDSRFDVAFMTGHAFQVLLADKDIVAALRNTAVHLVPGGTFAFETRNPALAWEQMFEGEANIETEMGPVKVIRHVEWRREGRIHFRSHYQMTDGERVSKSTLRFAERGEIEDMLEKSGFSIVTVYGNWDRTPFQPQTSREMIFVATRRG